MFAILEWEARQTQTSSHMRNRIAFASWRVILILPTFEITHLSNTRALPSSIYQIMRSSPKS